ncbi:methionine ABC transporter ATP-binding protein [Rhodoligotrophos appendicifer]|uniref:methionine ABC transporter ATP-binding protein n=1 Tax=Rhodoligotrophos appendicifer TaxID=987056 RepID=UPI0011846CB4|nr:methionine ABC transporter ATP-binding protein [Rhodoligotrophos appendicifer]
MVRLAGVSKRFEARGAAASVAALDDVSLDIPRGGISSIIGRSGAGKSTLVRLLNGLERPTTGEVIVDGVDIARLDGAELRAARRAIGMVFQHFNLLSSRTAYDNVALPLELQGLDSRRIRARVEPLLDLVGLADKRDRYPAELSGGQKQRVGIARALATEPKLLLSDEATSALDPETTRSILELLARINREFGLTIALITHEMDVVKQIASRVAVLDAGRIVEQGDVFDLFSAPQHEVTRAFLGADRSRALPAFVAGQLHAEPRQDSRALVRITFAGEHATAPVISRLARILGVDVAILQGEVDEIAGRPFGTLLVAFANGPKVVDKVRDHLAEFGLTLEHLGYVA